MSILHGGQEVHRYPFTSETPSSAVITSANHNFKKILWAWSVETLRQLTHQCNQVHETIYLHGDRHSSFFRTPHIETGWVELTALQLGMVVR